MRKAFVFAAAAAFALTVSGFARAAGDGEPLKEAEWAHSGPFGTYDRAALQRGFQVYKEVCSGCHSLRLVAFRNLQSIGFSEAEVKAVAGNWLYPVATIDDEGEPTERQPLPADKFVPPFPNEKAARVANAGSLPPDLSLVVKARKGHEDYIYSLLAGYEEAPEDVELAAGMSYNPYFPGRQIAMPPPLFEDGVEYADGTEASVEQMAHDVTSFLAWTAEPKLEDRKRIGFKVVIFLIVLTVLLYLVKRKVWSDLH